MTTREELHALIDRLEPESLDDVATWLRKRAAESGGSGSVVVSEVDGLPLPASLGAGESGVTDLARRVDDYLAEGFGR